MSFFIRYGDERIVFFRGDIGQRLEPVRVVGCSVRDRPVLHGLGNDVRDGRVQIGALIDGAAEFLGNRDGLVKKT